MDSGAAVDEVNIQEREKSDARKRNNGEPPIRQLATISCGGNCKRTGGTGGSPAACFTSAALPTTTFRSAARPPPPGTRCLPFIRLCCLPVSSCSMSAVSGQCARKSVRRSQGLLSRAPHRLHAHLRVRWLGQFWLLPDGLHLAGRSSSGRSSERRGH